MGSMWIRPEKRKRIYQRDDHRCMYCNVDIYTDATLVLTLDHVIPRELGGGNEATNLVTACLSCNASKQDKPLRQFVQVLADRGVDPEDVKKRIRNARGRKLPK